MSHPMRSAANGSPPAKPFVKPARNRRVHERTRSTAALLWRRPGDDVYQVGWLLETSDGGFAFACRGGAPPVRGEVIRTRRGQSSAMGTSEQMHVRRTQKVHEDLTIVACANVPEGSEAGRTLQGLLGEIAPHRPSRVRS